MPTEHMSRKRREIIKHDLIGAMPAATPATGDAEVMILALNEARRLGQSVSFMTARTMLRGR